MNEQQSMRAFLQVLSGRFAGKRVWLDPTSAKRVGQSTRADFVIGDHALAPIHFEATWNGETCRFSNTSNAPLIVNEQPVENPVDMGNGAVVQAGQTSFLLRILPADLRAGLPPAPPTVRPATEELIAARARVLATLTGTARLYAILDAARDRRVRSLLVASGEMHESLFEGQKGHHLAEVAPYLVEFASPSALLDVVVNEGWGESWGVYLVGLRPFSEIRRRLRRLLMVRDEENDRKLYFRYYDPRVLRTFWASASPRQQSEMLGTEIQSFLLENVDDTLVQLDA